MLLYSILFLYLRNIIIQQIIILQVLIIKQIIMDQINFLVKRRRINYLQYQNSRLRQKVRMGQLVRLLVIILMIQYSRGTNYLAQSLFFINQDCYLDPTVWKVYQYNRDPQFREQGPIQSLENNGFPSGSCQLLTKNKCLAQEVNNMTAGIYDILLYANSLVPNQGISFQFLIQELSSNIESLNSVRQTFTGFLGYTKIQIIFEIKKKSNIRLLFCEPDTASVYYLDFSLIKQQTTIQLFRNRLFKNKCQLRTPWNQIKYNQLNQFQFSDFSCLLQDPIQPFLDQPNICYINLNGCCLTQVINDLPQNYYQLSFDFINSQASSRIKAYIISTGSTPNTILSETVQYLKDFKQNMKLYFANAQSSSARFILCDSQSIDTTYVSNFQLKPTQDLCTQSQLTQQGVRSCLTCLANNFLVYYSDNVTTCVPKLIQKCKYYGADRNCRECQSGVTYNRITKSCQIPQFFIQNCITLIRIGQTDVCRSCQVGYTLTFNNRCIRKILYCSVYADNICKNCIFDYFWNGQICLKQIQFCQNYGSKGQCTQCSKNNFLQNGRCYPIPLNQQDTFNQLKKCPKYQYLNQKMECVEGTIQGCQEYERSSQRCIFCQKNFKLSKFGTCTIVCPLENNKQRFIISKNRCVKVDKSCISFNQEGFCFACQNSYYLFDGKCYGLQNLQNRSETLAINQRIFKESGFTYILNNNGSRSYIDGPWTSLEVWADNRGFLYYNIRNRVRKYLDGPQENQNTFLQAGNKWYYYPSNSNQKIYFQDNKVDISK